MKKHWRLLLVLVAVVSFGIALSYPVLYKMAEESNNRDMEELSAMRRQVMEEEAAGLPHDNPDAENTDTTSGHTSEDQTEGAVNGPSVSTQGETGGDEKDPDAAAEGSDSADSLKGTEDETASAESEKDTEGRPESPDSETDTEDGAGSAGSAEQTAGKTESAEENKDPEDDEDPVPNMPVRPEAEEPEPEPEPMVEDYMLDYVPGMAWRQVPIPEYEQPDAPVLLARRTMAENRNDRTEPLPYTEREKVVLDEDKILPELKGIYELNHDVIGWIVIDDTVVDYPVVQREDMEYYLTHDFYGEENQNGQIILDKSCDPFTPSYNLVVSGHHMNNGSMFGGLPMYKDEAYYKEHRIVEFDTLMERRKYIIFGAFYSADYDEYEEGFRYNADVRFKIDAEEWLKEIAENSIYETGVDAVYGDEFVTLTTCDRSRRRDGRFVVVCRRIREGEVFDE